FLDDERFSTVFYAETRENWRLPRTNIFAELARRGYEGRLLIRLRKSELYCFRRRSPSPQRSDSDPRRTASIAQRDDGGKRREAAASSKGWVMQPPAITCQAPLRARLTAIGRCTVAVTSGSELFVDDRTSPRAEGTLLPKGLRW